MINTTTEMSNTSDINVVDLPTLFGNPYVLKILSATLIRPKTVQELSIKYDIPIAACYRRVRLLEQKKLLKYVDKVLTTHGKWVKRYLSTVRNITLTFEKGKIHVKADISALSYDSSWDILYPKKIIINK